MANQEDKAVIAKVVSVASKVAANKVVNKAVLMDTAPVAHRFHSVAVAAAVASVANKEASADREVREVIARVVSVDNRVDSEADRAATANRAAAPVDSAVKARVAKEAKEASVVNKVAAAMLRVALALLLEPSDNSTLLTEDINTNLI